MAKRCARAAHRLFIPGASHIILSLMSLIPSVTFDPDALPPDQRAEAWTRFFQALHHVRPLPIPGREVRSRAVSWFVDDLVFGHAHFDAQTMEREVGKEIVAGARKFLFGWIYRRGNTQIYHDGDIIDVGTGTYCIFDYDRDMRAIATDSEVIGVILPYEYVGYQPAIHPPRLLLDLQSPQGKLLKDVHESVLMSAPTMQQSDAPAVAAAVKAVFASVIQNHTQSDMRANSKARDIRQYIDENIFDPKMTIAALTAHFGVSRATLYRLLDMPGGLKSYVTTRRLDYAFRALTFGGAKRGRIAEIAALSGYKSAHQFSSAFSKRFGFSPSVVLGAFADMRQKPGRLGENPLWDSWHGSTPRGRE